MQSQVYWKYRAFKSFSSVKFEGESIELQALKKEIVAAKKLNTKTDFDFKIVDAQTAAGYALLMKTRP